MSRVYVALDLETTGLSAERDSIIELGAVRFRDGEVLDTFSQIVNPGRAIPRAIQQMTGISQAEADRAPSLASVASRFRSFVGDAPLIGHNIRFDAEFLQSNNLYRYNPLIDTWEMAVILLPGLPSYKLGRVAEVFGLSIVNAHRAFDDAEASFRIFEALRQRAMALPAATLQQINKLATNSEWELRDLFAECEREAAARWGRGRPVEKKKDAGPLFDELRPLEPLARPQPLNVDDLAGMLGPEGRFAQAFDNYEHRPPQIAMLRAVAEAFNSSRHALVEAGTGTGKSVAYLIPALAWASQTGRRVVVSSNTINLQDQLFHKDLPDLRHILPFDFKVAVMKGRNNYLCPRRLQHLMERPDLTAIEISVLARILVWMPTTQTGDQAEITLINGRERSVWQRVCSDGATCSPNRCKDASGQPCFYYRARRLAEAAHVIIINHALLLADIAIENNAIPAYQHLIIDEAHHLEDAATNALTLTMDHPSFVATLRELAPTGGETKAVGLLSDIATAVRNACPPDRSEKVVALTRELHEALPTLDMRTFELMDAIERFVKDLMGRRKSEENKYDVKQRITNTERVQPAWVNVEITCDSLSTPFKRFVANLANLLAALGDLSNYAIANIEELTGSLLSIHQALSGTYHLIEATVFKPDPGAIYWVRLNQQQSAVSLNSAPLHVGNLIQTSLMLPRDTVVLTSATLRTQNSFDYLRNRLAIEAAEEYVLESPFDYRTHALVFVPTDIPEPNEPAYQSKVEAAILQLGLATEGRLMALFTSYAQLQRTAEALRPLLEEAGLTVYIQGEGGSRQQILDAFRKTDRAVIMGTRSFWEGVDVQGDALSALVIARLPFAVPTDPIVSARSETFDNAFYQYSVPEAILQLRQGFGRLIRSASDRGVCVLLDRRVSSKPYGRLFLESLPGCTIKREPLANLPVVARGWLAGAVAAGPAPSTADASGPPAAPRRPVSSDPFAGFDDYLPAPPPPEWWE